MSLRAFGAWKLYIMPCCCKHFWWLLCLDMIFDKALQVDNEKFVLSDIKISLFLHLCPYPTPATGKYLTILLLVLDTKLKRRNFHKWCSEDIGFISLNLIKEFIQNKIYISSSLLMKLDDHIKTVLTQRKASLMKTIMRNIIYLFLSSEIGKKSSLETAFFYTCLKAPYIKCHEASSSFIKHHQVSSSLIKPHQVS